MGIQERWEQFVSEHKHEYSFTSQVNTWLNWVITGVEIVDEEMELVKIDCIIEGHPYTITSNDEWLVNHTMTIEECFGFDKKLVLKIEAFLNQFQFIEKIKYSITDNKQNMLDKWNEMHHDYFKTIRLKMIVSKRVSIVSCIESFCFDEATWINKNQLYQYFEIKGHNEHGEFVYRKDEEVNEFVVLPEKLEPLKDELVPEFLAYIEHLGLEKFIRFYEKTDRIWKKENPFAS